MHLMTATADTFALLMIPDTLTDARSGLSPLGAGIPSVTAAARQLSSDPGFANA